MARTYTREEVQAIIARAVERQHGRGDGLTHEEVQSIGRELGISGDAIDAAAASFGDEMVVEREVRARVFAARRGFFFHLVPYLLVNVLLATINLFTGGPPWFLLAALGWGIGLATHALAALAPDRAKLERKVRRRIQAEREKEQRRARRADVQQGARRVAEAVHDRTVEVLHAVADALEGSAPPKGDRVRVDAREEERPADGAASDRGAEVDEPGEDEAPPQRARGRS
jgi:hypothetical protein